MLIPKKNRLEVYKYLFRGAQPAVPQPASPRCDGCCDGRPAPPGWRRARLRPRARRRSPHHHGVWRSVAAANPSAEPPLSSRSAEGVCFAEKDYNLPKHPEIDVPNLHARRRRAGGCGGCLAALTRSRVQVIKLMQSFKSKEFVKEQFAWRHYYWYLTNEGIEARASRSRPLSSLPRLSHVVPWSVPAHVPEPAG